MSEKDTDRHTAGRKENNFLTESLREIQGDGETLCDKLFVEIDFLGRMNKVYASGRRDANYPPIPPEASRKITLVPESIGSSIADQDLVSILTDPCCIDTYFLMPEVGWVRITRGKPDHSDPEHQRLFPHFFVSF